MAASTSTALLSLERSHCDTLSQSPDLVSVHQIILKTSPQSRTISQKREIDLSPTLDIASKCGNFGLPKCLILKTPRLEHWQRK